MEINTNCTPPTMTTIINKNLFIGLVAILLISPSFGSDKTTGQFLSGTSNTTCMRFVEADAGRIVKLKFNSQIQVYPSAIKISGGQSNLEFVAMFRSGLTSRLLLDFDVGFSQGLEKPSNRYCIGQFDFDKDGTPELLVAVVDPNYDGMTGVSLNVLKYRPPLNLTDISRNQNWEIIGKLTAPNVAGDAKVSVKDISVTIPRNHRKFYYEISWVKGRFVETSDY